MESEYPVETNYDLNVALVMLTWKRISALKHSLKALNSQTYKNFTIYISNGNLDTKQVEAVNRFCKFFKGTLNIKISHDGNDLKSFRKLTTARRAAENGADVILFLDDDIDIPSDYVERCISQYEPKKYKSGFAWTFHQNGKDYYKLRTRMFDNSRKIHYCGSGVAMIDASIFFNEGLYDAPAGALGIEDLWLSYYADHILGWELMHMDIRGTRIEGDDAVALFKAYLENNGATYTKADFLRELVKMGWNLEEVTIRRPRKMIREYPQ